MNMRSELKESAKKTILGPATKAYLKNIDTKVWAKNQWLESEIKTCQTRDEKLTARIIKEWGTKPSLSDSFYPQRTETVFNHGNGFIQLRELTEKEKANQYAGALLFDCDDTMIRGSVTKKIHQPYFIHPEELRAIIRLAKEKNYFLAAVTFREFEKPVYPDPLSVAECLRQLDPDMHISHILYTHGLSKSSACHFIQTKFSIPLENMTIVDDLQDVLDDCGAIGVKTILATNYGGHFFQLKKMLGCEVSLGEKFVNFAGKNRFFRMLVLEEEEPEIIYASRMHV